MLDKERVLENVKKNLKRNRSVATGIGIFGAIYDEEKILLIIRKEKGSIIYGQDLRGRWEMPGGGLEFADLTEDYQSQILNCLKRELKEEAGIELLNLKEIIMLPAWLSKKGLIDLAFVVPISSEFVKETEKFRKLYNSSEVAYFSIKEVEDIEITSNRMKFMISETFKYILWISPI